MPAALPTAESNKDSVSVCRINRERLAPRQTRTAISCRRDAPRAKRSPARFAQASNNSKPTIAIKTVSGVESIAFNGVDIPCPAGSSRDFILLTNGPASGALTIDWKSTAISARACCIDSPALSVLAVRIPIPEKGPSAWAAKYLAWLVH
jgi:hypothetical protein